MREKALLAAVLFAGCAQLLPPPALAEPSPAPSPPVPIPIPIDDGLPAGEHGGHCDAPFPPLALGKWRHPTHAAWTTAQGSPHHRVRDLILAPGAGGKLRGRFTYGFVDKDLEGEEVELWVLRCPSWVRWSTHVTSDDGVAFADVPASLAPGDYRVRFVVRGDNSFAEGTIAVWRAGTRVVVSDVDGTLTTGDDQSIRDYFLAGDDAVMYPDAEHVLRAWAERGYRIVYLTGRPQIMNRYTREWLARHRFPPGVLHLTEEATSVLPTDAGVRLFKAAFLKDGRDRARVRWEHAYGNAVTDVGAYDDAGIPKARTYIIGPHAGAEGTVALKSYTAQLPEVLAAPSVTQP